MKIISGFENLSSLLENTVIAIGNFDGVHLGHQKILEFLVNKAKKLSLYSLVLTFSPHPEKILGEKKLKMIQTLDQRLEEIRKFNIQAALVVLFDEKFSHLSGQEFIKKVVVNLLRAKAVVVGENFRFGKNREGNIYLFQRVAQRYDLKLYSIPSVVKKGRIVSSSLIRSLLEESQIEKVNTLLGRPYEIEGEVIKGKSRGKTLGFPTANIQTKNELVPLGVFITTVKINSNPFPSLTNVGRCPTFSQQKTNIESYIINFNKNLYGKKIRVHFIKKIRDETKFETPEVLSHQIKKDLEKTKTYFNMT